MDEQMTVECPHCSARFETHTVGDLCGCEECGETFRRFQREVVDDTPREELEP